MATEKQIDSVKSRDGRYASKRNDAMYISRSLVNSDAWKELKGASMLAYTIFLTKRQIEKVKYRASRSKTDFRIVNNGEIQFTYQEAEERGVTRPRFARAIDQLVELGFIDIARAGSGLHKDATQYGISDRWKEYGTDEFVAMKRPKRKLHYGFQKGHK